VLTNVSALMQRLKGISALCRAGAPSWQHESYDPARARGSARRAEARRKLKLAPLFMTQ
jgi:hypothetical protein